jgi:hypothetical protein
MVAQIFDRKWLGSYLYLNNLEESSQDTEEGLEAPLSLYSYFLDGTRRSTA